jgi:hypothetical protein
MASLRDGGINVPGNLNVFGDSDLAGDVTAHGAVTIDGAVTISTALARVALAPQADLPDPPAEGMLVAKTDYKLYFYNGTAWKEGSFVEA